VATEKRMMKQLLEQLRNGKTNAGIEGAGAAGGRTAPARLVEWGLAVEMEGNLCLAAGVSAEVVSLFAGLIDLFDPVLKPVALKGCPINFCTGLVRLPVPRGGESGAAGMTIPAGGQGRTPAMAAISCLGEMAERLSLFSKGAGDKRILSQSGEREDLPLGPVLGFSARQELSLAESHPALRKAWRNGRIDWNALSDRRLEVTNLCDGRQAQVPAFGVLLGEREGLAGSVPGITSSSGAAVWSTREEAARRALRELAERDAFARAWYNRLGITRVYLDDWDRILPEKLAHYLISRTRRTGLLHVATDLDVHVLAAVSYQKNGFGGCLGVAAAPVAADAAFSAVAEMLQAEMSLELSARAYETDRRHGDAKMPRELAVAGTLRLSDALGLEDLPRADQAALERVFEADDLARSCHQRNIDLWLFDATTADLGVPCVKMLSPHLCSWQPRFGKARLFTGTDGSGVGDTEALETEFEKRPFPF